VYSNADDQVDILRIPAILNGTNVFVDPISFVIKAAAAPVRCNDVPLTL
jgi:hypothetical protein